MKLFIGIPSSRYYQPFWESLSLFLIKIKEKYNIEIMIVKDLPLDEARNRIVDLFLISDCDYLLFLDDDHEGHSIEMLDSLINVDTYVCAIKCHSRFFPFLPNLLYYSGIQDDRMKYEFRNHENGIHQHDLVGFGMTLIRRDTFSVIDKPYFVSDEGTQIHEDNYFCDKLIKAGISPMGCWDHTLSHQGIDATNVTELKDKNMKAIIEDLVSKNPDIKDFSLSIIA